MPLHVAALLGAFSLLSVARADGNVGCLFSETLCLDKVEWCFDDLAFGRCVQRNADEEDLHRFSSLTHSQLHELKQELHRLLALGYRWNHPHTQCRLQGMLYALHHGLDFEPEQCIHLIDRQLEEIPFEDIETEEEMDEPVAYVRFTPSVADPHADFADEIYYPAPEEEMLAVEPIDENFIETRVSNIPTNQLLAEVIGEIDDSDIYNPQQSYDNMPHPEMTKKSTRDLEELAFIPAMHRRSSRDAIFSREYNTPQDFRLGQETRDLLNVLPQFPDNKSPYLTENSDPSGLSFNIDPETFLRAQADHMYHPRQSVIGYSDNFDGTDRFITRPLTESDPNAMNFDTRYMESDDGPNIVDSDDTDDSEQDVEEFLPVIEYLNKLHLRPDDMEYLLKPENVDILRSLLPDDFEENDGTFQKNFNTIPDDALIQTWLDSEEAQRLRNKLAQIRAYNRMNSRGVFEKTNDAQHMLDYTSDAPEQRIYYEDDDNYEDAGSTVPEPEFFRTVDEIPVSLSQTEENNQSPFREMHTIQNMNENNDKEIFRELKLKEKSHTHPEHDSNDFLQLGNKFQPRHPEENLKAGVYTEGGIVFVPETPETGNLAQNDEALNEEIMSELDNDDWGFKRRERLDVKKPGPPFNTKPHPQTEHININNEIKSNDISETKVKKELSHDNEFNAITELNSHDQYDVDTSYAYMDFKNSLKTWREGNHIVNVLAELLHLKHESFSHTRIERNEVTFKVEPNSLGLNASTVALKIDELKDALKERTGVEVTSAGIGDKTKLPVVRWAAITPTGDAWVFTEGRVLLAGCLLAAIVLAGGTLALLRRHAASRRKLQDLAAGDVSGHDTEASRDYQDLCRSRMASKGAQPTSSTASGEKPESVHGRITSLSRESEGGSQQSPSSRSSTSSWSEEPALSNMDISTGHMVLSYMEDHLKNKDRLEQEWVALCAYEAEPCATTEATRPENIEKNRNPHVLPYDHSRVVLGQLANAAGSDYINASTITDHDPRNPAYIATQGPLPNTAADFWQMIWEQGSVVMVMLTRLTEGGVAMCHRYWPEEGSELYHIYEVHLVSEHIWCDDYLVRSFYLKNIKTGETRTVTQFHFLSWPDMGVPASTKALLEFRRKVNKSYRGRSCPIVVHCSDGAGRTGTYSLIDMVLNRMAKGAKEIDIAATLEHIRDQRPVMVATRQQFEFVLTAVAEEVHAILKALPPGPTPPSTATSTTAEKL